MQQLIDFFNKIEPLQPPALQAVLGVCTTITLAKNEILQPIGHTCKTIYFVKKGIARIYYYKDGLDITESFAAENAIVARAESLFAGRPSQKGIQIVEDAEIIGINAIELFKIYDTYPKVERLFRKIFEQAHVETIQRMELIQFHGAEARYKILLSEHPDFIRRIPLKYIASYLGVTQVTLSRIRASIR